MVKGVPTLSAPHQLCTKGKALSAEQAQLLKLIGEKLVVFRVRLKARWDSTTGEVTMIESSGDEDDETASCGDDEDGSGSEEDAMSD